jgi:hypothetical protein
MGEKIVVGPINRGLTSDRTPFVIDNDSFPILINAFQWRGRAKRKRGTSLLNRLARFFNSLSTVYNPGFTTITLDGSGNGNLLTGFTALEPNASIQPGSVTITAPGPTIFTDPAKNGTLSPSGTINYSTGAITIAAEAGLAISATFSYYPTLPVMGLRDLVLASSAFPGNLAFDTTYSYNILPSAPNQIYDVSFYKNPPTALYPGYTQKASSTSTTWNGQNYQQFWSTNYQGAFWVTNGITVPFTTTNIGMQFAPSSTITYVSNTSTTLVVTITNCPLVIGDFVFANEWSGTNSTTLNFQTGYVTAAAPNTPPFATKTLTITFPNATIGAGSFTPGILQYLTNRSSPTLDNIRWYDGDPTNGVPASPTFVPGNGWVNFMPPLSNFAYSIADEPQAVYYLVGARMIFPFKDRLLFFGPVIQTSSANSQVYLQDTVIYSQNGTPYYTASFPGAPSAQTAYTPLLVPIQQTATPEAYWEDQTGYGGFITAGIDQPITTVSPNADALIVGLNNLETRLISTGNDIVPFNFYIINSELGSGSTFSIINMDKGVLTKGSRGYIVTSQVEAKRFDLEIPDEVFESGLINNGTERVTAQRDYINEWVYFSYPSNQQSYVYPGQTLQYNYRDDSWGLFYETYTTYGTIRLLSGYTWATIGQKFPTWSSWNEPWNAGSTTLLHPKVMGGTPQGFVITREQGTNEATSIAIQNISGNTITSPDHCLNENDYFIISGVLGTVGPFVNGKIFSVQAPITTNSFTVNPNILGTGTYLGGGLIQRMYVPQIITKQFPVSWGMGRKTRLGPQQYLFSTTPNGEVTLLIFLSQNSQFAYNVGPVVPAIESINNSLIYSTVLFTCPESTNLGLTPANINLNMITAAQQEQIWHRMNTSLLGDTVQVGFTLLDAQMRDPLLRNQFVEIELHAIILDVNPSQLLS